MCHILSIKGGWRTDATCFERLCLHIGNMTFVETAKLPQNVTVSRSEATTWSQRFAQIFIRLTLHFPEQRGQGRKAWKILMPQLERSKMWDLRIHTAADAFPDIWRCKKTTENFHGIFNPKLPESWVPHINSGEASPEIFG